MSKYIGKRVSYPCENCGKQFTINKKTVDKSVEGIGVFCCEKCYQEYIAKQQAEENK